MNIEEDYAPLNEVITRTNELLSELGVRSCVNAAHSRRQELYVMDLATEEETTVTLLDLEMKASAVLDAIRDWFGDYDVEQVEKPRQEET